MVIDMRKLREEVDAEFSGKPPDMGEANGGGRGNGEGGERGDGNQTITKLSDWLKRDLPPPDRLLGHWLTTTTRALMWAPTGSGKTMIATAMAFRASASVGFLGWQGWRPARCLYVDGEMSRRLLKDRLVKEARRSGLQPSGLHILSHEDVANFAPLNTPQGQAQIEQEIKRIGGVDFITLDNVMSLIVGDMKDEEAWRQTLPWQHSLTRRNIGQLWLHHTGHDETRGYGTKTREWQMDTVIGLEEVKREDTDVSFLMTFRKARERTPATREDFADRRVALVDDQWECTAPDRHPKKVTGAGQKFLTALQGAIIGSTAKMYGQPAATIESWRMECVKVGLLGKDRPDSERALFSKYRRELIVADRIACNDTMAWLLSDGFGTPSETAPKPSRK
jgi:hypothetical protein